MRRIGIMGGTFDPVHNGHLLLGRQAYREYALDEVWFMPSHVPPHKKDHCVTDSTDRMNMLKLALAGIPGCVVSDFEMKREGNTYTAQTLALLRENYPEYRFYFIIGEDSLFQLETWYMPKQVMSLTAFLVSCREYQSGGVSIDEQIRHLHETYGADISLLHNEMIDVASADIRRRAAAGKSIREFVPEAVADYIERRGLYREKGSISD